MDIKEILKEENEFTDEQIEKFSEGFLALKKEYKSTDIETINDKKFQRVFGEKFDELVVGLGFEPYNPDESEYVLYHIWELNEDYQSMMEYITIIYREVIKMSDQYMESIFQEMCQRYMDGEYDFDDE